MVPTETRLLLLALFFLAIDAGLFVLFRRRLREKPHLRVFLFLIGSALVAGGVAAARWLPGKFPETPGSAASLVWTLGSWFLAGLLVLFGLPGVVAAILPGPR